MRIRVDLKQRSDPSLRRLAVPADTRSKREKLQAMASQTSSPREAEVARRLLESLPPPRTLTRDDIMGKPDVRAPSRPRRYFDPSLRVTVILDADDPVFDVGPDEYDL
jgi:hypothetical protein